MTIRGMNLLALGAFTLASLGCSSSSSNGQGSYDAPDYAFPSGQGWHVQCGFKQVSVPGFRVESFYNEDGTLLTEEEFCER